MAPECRLWQSNRDMLLIQRSITPSLVTWEQVASASFLNLQYLIHTRS